MSTETIEHLAEVAQAAQQLTAAVENNVNEINSAVNEAVQRLNLSVAQANESVQSTIKNKMDVTLIVSPEGEDSTATGSSEFPFKTLKGAIESTPNNAKVFIKPQGYTELNPLVCNEQILIKGHNVVITTDQHPSDEPVNIELNSSNMFAGYGFVHIGIRPSGGGPTNGGKLIIKGNNVNIFGQAENTQTLNIKLNLTIEVLGEGVSILSSNQYCPYPCGSIYISGQVIGSLSVFNGSTNGAVFYSAYSLTAPDLVMGNNVTETMIGQSLKLLEL